MNLIRAGVVFFISISLISLAGCGVSKNKYEALLNEKMALEEKVASLTTTKEVLKSEYDDLLKEKIELTAKLETVTNEKTALKDEYDKILDEKIAIKAAYDKLFNEVKAVGTKIVETKPVEIKAAIEQELSEADIKQ